MIVAPCKECKERFPACHDVCIKYKDWWEAIDKIKKTLCEYNRLDDQSARCKKEAMCRMIRRSEKSS